MRSLKTGFLVTGVMGLFLAGFWSMGSLVPVKAETAGSYAHPDIPGPDEGNPMGRPLHPGSGSSEKAASPSTRTEGSAVRGYGPGAHPPKAEGSGGKARGWGKGGPHGSPHRYGHGASEGSAAKSPHGYAHGRKYGHGKRQGSGSKQGRGYAGRGGYGKHHGYRGQGHEGSGHHGGYGHHGFAAHASNPFRHILRYKDKLGLSPDQVSQVKDLQFNWEKQRIRLGADLMIAYMELDKIVHSGTLDETRMHDLAKVLGGLKQQEAQIMVEAKIQLLRLLTPEQRRKVAEIHSGH